jgi:hypothetical protein
MFVANDCQHKAPCGGSPDEKVMRCEECPSTDARRVVAVIGRRL